MNRLDFYELANNSKELNSTGPTLKPGRVKLTDCFIFDEKYLTIGTVPGVPSVPHKTEHPGQSINGKKPIDMTIEEKIRVIH